MVDVFVWDDDGLVLKPRYFSGVIKKREINLVRVEIHIPIGTFSEGKNPRRTRASFSNY